MVALGRRQTFVAALVATSAAGIGGACCLGRVTDAAAVVRRLILARPLRPRRAGQP